MSEIGKLNRRQALFASLWSAGITGGIAMTPSAARAEPAARGRSLVVYLSRSGNTRVIASQLARTFRADLFEIRTAEPYPEDYREMVAWAKALNDASATPRLAAAVATIRAYQTIFLGFPIWGAALPAPIRTFLATHDLSEKTLVPFVTHSGYGTGSSLTTLAALAPRARIQDAFVLQRDGERDAISRLDTWLSDHRLRP